MHTQAQPQEWVQKFVEDRAFGWQAEDELIRRLALLNITAHRNPATDLEGKQKNDILIDSSPYPWFVKAGDSIEVKTDRKWPKTGNVAVEWAALKHSTADHVAYFMSDTFFIQTRRDLMITCYANHIRFKRYRETRGGDWSDLLTLILVQEFIEPCKVLRRLPNDNDIRISKAA